MTVQGSRIKELNHAQKSDGEYVLYWMQQSQRAEDNHALEYAIDQANKQEKMVVVVFSLTENYPDANIRHYTFLLEGLKETQIALAKRGIQLIFKIGHPVMEVLEIGQKASMIVCDRGYLKHQRRWRKQISKKAGCPVIQVETDVLVPIEEVSDCRSGQKRPWQSMRKIYVSTIIQNQNFWNAEPTMNTGMPQ